MQDIGARALVVPHPTTISYLRALACYYKIYGTYTVAKGAIIGVYTIYIHIVRARAPLERERERALAGLLGPPRPRSTTTSR